MRPKITLSKNFQLIALKLLHESLFILIILFFFSLLAESVLPGLVSSRLGLWLPALLLVLNVFLINWLKEKTGILDNSKEALALNKKEALFVFLVLFIFVFNSVLRLSLFLGIILSLFSAFAGCLIFILIQKRES